MIADALIGIIRSLVLGVLDALPTFSTPSWVSDIGDKLSSAIAGAGALGAWLPLTLAGQVFAFVLVCVGIGFLVKVIRIVVSFFTAGGGSAG